MGRLRKYFVAFSVILDIGNIIDRVWAVIGANPTWDSSIYCSDPEAVLLTIARAAIPLANLSLNDEKWVISRRVQNKSQHGRKFYDYRDPGYQR
jgi:hypothetical protein